MFVSWFIAIVLCFLLLFCAAFCSIFVVSILLQCLARFLVVGNNICQGVGDHWSGVIAEFASELVKRL